MKTESNILPENVQSILKKHMLIDGFDMTLDVQNSKKGYLYDSKSKTNYLDFFTFVSSNPLGMNHPKLNNKEFIDSIGKVALSKPSLSDIYPIEQAEFVETFFKIAVPEYFKYVFFIEGGSLAVENCLKAAIDWKVRKNFKKGYKEEKGHQIIHFKDAFHGRSGYCLSLTNTDPIKIQYFPKFNWPRVSNPVIEFPLDNDKLNDLVLRENKTLEEINEAIKNNPDDIAAIIIEPIQGEGGDNHFRKEFFQGLRKICDENDILLIFDEVQTGIAITGKWWAHQYFVKPDLLAFGKKTQVCGILSTDRIDEIEDNVFHIPSRINSTWGGNLTDMVRFKKILEIINEEDLVENCKNMGQYLLSRISEITEEFKHILFNARGLGLFCAFDVKNADLRNAIIKKCMENKLLILGCGYKTVRFRPPLTINKANIDKGIEIIRDSIRKL